MTYNSFDREDLLNRSDLTGFSAYMAGTFPDTLSSTTTGGGSVATGQYHTDITAGGTAGDTAYLGNITTNSGFGDFSRVIAQFTFIAGQDMWNDEFMLGFGQTLSDRSDNENGALDFTNGVYRVGSNTASATLPGTNDCIELIVDVDFDNNETTFSQTGSVNESVTIGAVPFSVDAKYLAMAESNGNGDGIGLHFLRIAVIP